MRQYPNFSQRQKRHRPFYFIIRILILIIIITISIAGIQAYRFYHASKILAEGTVIAGIHVGGLYKKEAEQQLQEHYLRPIELHYREMNITLEPETIDFQLDTKSMITEASNSESLNEVMNSYREFVLNQKPTGEKISLKASYSKSKLYYFLTNEISVRYDIIPLPVRPEVSTNRFLPSKQGSRLDVDKSISIIDRALHSLNDRSVELPYIILEPTRVGMEDLEQMLKQSIINSGFDGLIAVYVLDLETGQDLYFVYRLGEDLQKSPDVAFTASSLIKIPIMVSAFKKISSVPEANEIKIIDALITTPGNLHLDDVMLNLIDRWSPTKIVTDDMLALGLENTFIAGYFKPDSVLIELINTPANQRNDVSTNPDLYNQTSPTNIGKLLKDIYVCSQNGEGDLIETFGGEITRDECRMMIKYLEKIKIKALLEAGLPENTPLARMYGWEAVDGIIFTLGDAGVVRSPGGDYVVATFIYHPVQVIWDVVNDLVSELSGTTYNYFKVQ